MMALIPIPGAKTKGNFIIKLAAIVITTIISTVDVMAGAIGKPAPLACRINGFTTIIYAIAIKLIKPPIHSLDIFSGCLL
jgi:hypothetical protein